MSKTIKISIRIIAVFMVAFIMSFIPDLFPNSFGDILCQGKFSYNSGIHECYRGVGNLHNPEWHWGYRHFIWLFMGASLFLVQLVDIICIIDDKK